VADAEITRAESRERARLLRVRSCAVGLDFTRGPEFFGSVSLIRFDCREPGAASHADLIAKCVREITLNGVPLDPADVWADGRITLRDLAARNELRVVADCAYSSSGTGMSRFTDADGAVCVYAKLAQAYARTAYACFDQPDLKAVFTFEVTAPRGWTVLSNQPRDESQRSSDSPSVRFLPTAVVPAFTTTVVAGNLHVVRASHVTPGGREIPLELACRASQAGRLDAGELFALTAKGLDFYTGWLGADYPYGKYGQVFVPEFPHLASEDAGCVLLSERLLFPAAEASAARAQQRTATVLHEMAHMWFGDCATQRWWNDLWLSESFAEFCEAHSQAALGLDPDAWATLSVLEGIPAFADDRLPSSHPVASDAATVSAAIASFDGISYAKGAAVLRQLSAYAGEENFTAALRAYLVRHSYGNATLADLIDAVADASGKDLTAWSKAWLETAGPNILRCAFETGADGRFTEFAVVQEAPPRQPVLRPHRVTLGLYRLSGETLARVRGVGIDVTGARTEVPSLVGEVQPDLLLLNDDGTDYVIVRFDPRSLATALSSAGLLPDLAARAVCWNTVVDMVREAELPVTAFAAMLARAVRTESSIPVLSALRTHAKWLLRRFATPAQAAEVRRLLDATAPATAAAGPAWTAAARAAAIPDAGHKEAAWRLLTRETTGPETVTAVAAGFLRPEHADLLAPYAGRYLDEMPELWRTRAGHMRVLLAHALFPYPAVTPELLARMDAFLADPVTDPGLARIVRDHRDTAERALRARALDARPRPVTEGYFPLVPVDQRAVPDEL
jgi:aminopeptidase N